MIRLKDINWWSIALHLCVLLCMAAAFQLVTAGHQWSGFIVAIVTAFGYVVGHDYIVFKM